MGAIAKWVAGIFLAAYMLSPIDFIPDLLPWIGWMDDLALAGVVIYFIWTGRLPNMRRWPGRQRPFGRRNNRFTGSAGPSDKASGHETHDGQEQKSHRERQAAEEPEKETVADPYAVLGVPRGADKETIRAAYRKAAQAYHPDHVAHLGPELQTLARKKFIEIQMAYETLIKSAG